MADAYSQAYRFKAIMFTHTPELIERFTNSSVKVITDFEVTSIGVPTVTGLYYAAYRTFNALYYGYVNADILLNYTVFDARCSQVPSKPGRDGENIPSTRTGGQSVRKGLL